MHDQACGCKHDNLRVKHFSERVQIVIFLITTRLTSTYRSKFIMHIEFH